MPNAKMIDDAKCQRTGRGGFSLIESLAVVAILGIMAGVVLFRFAASSDTSKKNACYVNKGEIELQAQLWYRNKAKWPNANLKNIGSNLDYFPEGLPRCPVDGSSYRFDPATQRVIGHVH